MSRLALIAALALALLCLPWPALAQGEARTCSPGETVTIVGTGAPARTSLLIRFGGRPVGGGVSDAGGGYQLALQVGRERPGDYPIVVEVRETREVIKRLTCTVPGAATTRPAGTPGPTASGAPTRAPVAPTAVLTSPTPAGVAPAGQGCPADAPVKGNIVDRGPNVGEKIYHVSGGANYDATIPERCFASPAEAEAAGYRAAQQ